ncbi:outer membrane beta-barrel family protein [Prevotella multiformis]|uniref:outer membrane beta-barrel family protein n=1 Tax=Prevotella multiformis TaxID=282402 RepID=UPI0028DB7885|nr:outer membrane beta-barrel family protein [Prevotella multiformis]
MKIKSIFFILLFLLFGNVMQADGKNSQLIIHIKDSHSGEPLSYVQIDIRNTHDSLVCFSDTAGTCQVELPDGEYDILFGLLGYDKLQRHIKIIQHQSLDISLSANTKELDGVTVFARKRMIKLSDKGIVYDISKDAGVQALNLLDAINHVPLVNVTPNGNITVKGSSAYSIYLNGKPYRMAQYDPQTVLRSFPVSTVEKVEVITRLDGRYDGETGDAVINIITSRHHFNNWSLTLNGNSNTLPKAGAGISLVGTQKKIDFLVGYNYSYDGQRNQPVESSGIYSTPDSYQQNTASGISDGKWRTHTLRTMMVFNIDSLNSLYVDGHAMIKQTDMSTDWSQTFTDRKLTETLHTAFLSEHNNTAGTFETNLLYRKMFRKDKSKEHWMAGYRYTYNPDIRNFNQTYTDNTDSEQKSRNKTHGGLNEHSLTASITLVDNDAQFLQIGGKQIFRKGAIDTEMLLLNQNNEWVTEKDESSSLDQIHYRQDVSAAYASYSLSVKDFTFDTSLRWEYTHMKMLFPKMEEAGFSKTFGNMIPYIGVSYQRGNSSLSLSYNGGMVRPDILMLNPFKTFSSQYKAEMGNPELESSYINTVDASYMTYSNTVFLSCGFTYKHQNRPIVLYPSYSEEYHRYLSQYMNINSLNDYRMNFYGNYKPVLPLSLTLTGDFGWYRMKDYAGACDDGKSYNITFMCDVSLKNQWTLSLQYGNYLNMHPIWNRSHSFNIYSCSISKSFLKNALNVRAVINSPFDKFTEIREQNLLPSFSGSQTNFMRARAFGIDITYTLQKGTHKEIKRDRTLKSDDQKTGVE